MAGLDSTGFVIKTLPEIVSDINAKELALISPSLDVQPTAIIGVINGIYAAAVYELWQLAGALYNGMDPDQAVGDQLASLALLTGAPREPATATVVEQVTVNVSAGFNALPGTMFASVIGNAAVQFYNLTEVDNPTGISVDIVLDFICEITGPVQALSGTLTVIAQPLSGWNSITNASDGVVGKNIENDSQLRTRRVAELSAAGSSTAAAIRADMLALNDVPGLFTVPILICTVLYNDTEVTDANGVPPHSIEVIAYQPGATPDDDTALATAIFNAKAAGDGTHGTSLEVITDSQGNETTVYYTRPTEVPIYVVTELLVDPNTYPVDGDDQVKASLANFAVANYQAGTTVYAKHLQAEVFPVVGVLDINTFTLGTAPAPVGTGNITITIRETATLSTGNIDVTTVNP